MAEHDPTIVPAEPGWLAIYRHEGLPDVELPVIGWRVKEIADDDPVKEVIGDDVILVSGPVVRVDGREIDALTLPPYLGAAIGDHRYGYDTEFAGMGHESVRAARAEMSALLAAGETSRAETER